MRIVRFQAIVIKFKIFGTHIEKSLNYKKINKEKHKKNMGRFAFQTTQPALSINLFYNF